MKTSLAALAAALLLSLVGVGSAAADDDHGRKARGNTGPTLVARAIIPADAYQPGPPSGAAVAPVNGVTPPFPGQPIPGFSAVLSAGHGEYWGMPDNGYGAKGNSADFLLRLYRIRPDFKTARGGSGAVDVQRFLQLRDPDGKVPFALTRSDRVLTGADFDLESVRRVKDGSFWFGEEFGPFLLHTDATGKVLEAPVPLPGVQSPQSPFLPDPDAWNIPASRGFESMALSSDGKTLYPILEGALRTDPDPRRRVINEFDLKSGRYTDRKWNYRVDAAFPNAVLGDATAIDKHRYLVIERDDFQGVEAQLKKIYLVDLRRVGPDGYLEKRLVLDLLRITDPDGISLPARAGEFGVGFAFSFPLQSVESLEVLGHGRLLIANDNNYPGSDGRWIARDRPDDIELIVVDTPALRSDPFKPSKKQETLAVVGDTPYGAAQKTAFPNLVSKIDADPDVSVVLHLGDIKNGSSLCTDTYFAEIRALFDTFDDPLVYTPGDNEWTDCHRANNGGYNPLERLAAVRKLFFPRADASLGGRQKRLETQAEERTFRTFVENRLWEDEDVVYATLHVVGSNNNLAPWFADRPSGPETPAERASRLAEAELRIDAALAWLDETFEEADDEHAFGVVLAMQADMWGGGPAEGFARIIERIAKLAAEFKRPVLLLEGDTHSFKVDRPIPAAQNVTRIVVEGETASEWLRLTVDPKGANLFSWERIAA